MLQDNIEQIRIRHNRLSFIAGHTEDKDKKQVIARLQINIASADKDILIVSEVNEIHKDNMRKEKA